MFVSMVFCSIIGLRAKGELVDSTLDTLDALMRVSLNGFGVEFMDWNGIFDSWKTAPRTNKRRALLPQEVELDD